MKQIKETIRETLYSSPLLDFYFGGMRMGSMDIETTGLNSSRNKFILGGLYDFDSQEFRQVFAQSRTEEPEALRAYLDQLNRLDVIVSYNGRHFDLPFLASRYRKLFGERCDWRGPAGRIPYHLDLFLLVNGHSPVKHFVPNLKQKTIESYLGLWDKRTDEISGAESVELYDHYEYTRDPEAERQILLHNSDDVLQLARLLRILAKCDLHAGMYKRGFPAEDCTVNRIRLHRDRLHFSGIQRGEPVDYRCYEVGGFPAEAQWDRRAGTFSVQLPVIRQSGITVVDLYAAGLDTEPFEIYPTYSSGFLAIESGSGPHHMETNHFIKAFMGRLCRSMGKEL